MNGPTAKALIAIVLVELHYFSKQRKQTSARGCVPAKGWKCKIKNVCPDLLNSKQAEEIIYAAFEKKNRWRDEIIANARLSDPSTNLSTLLSTNACEGCNLSGIQLNGDNLTGGSKFTGADLDHANLANATLKNLTFVGAQFYQANLDNATLDRVELEQANLGSNSLSFTTMINSQISS